MTTPKCDDTSAAVTYRQRPYYDRDVDFDRLAREDPAFAAIAKAAKRRGFIDFQDPQVVQQLSKTILKLDFSLSLTLPPNRLCPPIPIRWNYIRWLHDLLDTTHSPTLFTDTPSPTLPLTGLDIGVGASCIYPLLATTSRPAWHMHGTDIDAHSLTFARANVESNNLQDRITLHHVDPLDSLIPEELHGGLDFVLTNPPFYADEEDLKSSSAGKAAAASAVCTGAPNEMFYADGGDLGFALRILGESVAWYEREMGRVALGEADVVGRKAIRNRWYTVMLGRHTSAVALVAAVRERGVDNVAVADLRAGHRTRRWAVGWSFGDRRPREDVIRHGELGKGLVEGYVGESTIWSDVNGRRGAGRRVREVMEGLTGHGLEWEWKGLMDAGVATCWENVWSRQARRKRKFREVDEEEEKIARDDDQVVMAIRISCKEDGVDVRWLRGRDHVMFVSFCGMLRRELSNKSKADA